jgi:hypothetical protein
MEPAREALKKLNVLDEMGSNSREKPCFQKHASIPGVTAYSPSP